MVDLAIREAAIVEVPRTGVAPTASTAFFESLAIDLGEFGSITITLSWTDQWIEIAWQFRATASFAVLLAVEVAPDAPMAALLARHPGATDARTRLAAAALGFVPTERAWRIRAAVVPD